MKACGMALTPEDRKHEGLILEASIHDNLCCASLDALSKKGFMLKNKEDEYAKKQVEELQIKIPDIESEVGSLSGGNQQKVVVGNWLNTNPKVMIYDEPSRGIDVNAKQQIFKIMWEQSKLGVSSIMVSTELEELLEVCQRILIMREGQIIKEIKPEDVSNDLLYTMCMGGE